VISHAAARTSATVGAAKTITKAAAKNAVADMADSDDANLQWKGPTENISTKKAHVSVDVLLPRSPSGFMHETPPTAIDAPDSAVDAPPSDANEKLASTTLLEGGGRFGKAKKVARRIIVSPRTSGGVHEHETRITMPDSKPLAPQLPLTKTNTSAVDVSTPTFHSLVPAMPLCGGTFGAAATATSPERPSDDLLAPSSPSAINAVGMPFAVELQCMPHVMPSAPEQAEDVLQVNSLYPAVSVHHSPTRTTSVGVGATTIVHRIPRATVRVSEFGEREIMPVARPVRFESDAQVIGDLNLGDRATNNGSPH
jgi:hypothetical protein